MWGDDVTGRGMLLPHPHANLRMWVWRNSQVPPRSKLAQGFSNSRWVGKGHRSGQLVHFSPRLNPQGPESNAVTHKICN